MKIEQMPDNLEIREPVLDNQAFFYLLKLFSSSTVKSHDQYAHYYVL